MWIKGGIGNSGAAFLIFIPNGFLSWNENFMNTLKEEKKSIKTGSSLKHPDWSSFYSCLSYTFLERKSCKVLLFSENYTDCCILNTHEDFQNFDSRTDLKMQNSNYTLCPLFFGVPGRILLSIEWIPDSLLIIYLPLQICN